MLSTEWLAFLVPSLFKLGSVQLARHGPEEEEEEEEEEPDGTGPHGGGRGGGPRQCRRQPPRLQDWQQTM